MGAFSLLVVINLLNRCISPDSITDTDDDLSEVTQKLNCLSPEDFSNLKNCSNPVFKRLPNFKYEGKCKDEFDRLHEILSFSPWRRRAEKSREVFNSNFRQKFVNGTSGRVISDTEQSIYEERAQLLSPSQWDFADDCSDNDACLADSKTGALAHSRFANMATTENDDLSDSESATQPDVDINGNHNSKIEPDELDQGSQCNDDVESLDGGASEGAAEDDEFAYAANLRVQNPHFTHRICFISEDQVNNFNNGEEAVSETELNESLRSLVDAYTKASPSKFSNDVQRNTSNNRCSDSERQYNGARNFDVSRKRNPNKNQDVVASSQSLPVFSNETGASAQNSKATTPINKRYTNVVNATSKMLSSYFQNVKQNQVQKRSPNYSELSEEEKTELNIQMAASFLKKQQELENEAKFALSQAKAMAKMQVKLESSANLSSDIVNEVLFESDSESVKSISFDDTFRQSLFSVDHNLLEILKTKLTDAIANTNVQLMEALVTKDSLRTQQEDLLAEIEDFTRHAQNQLHELQLLKIVSKTSLD